MSKITRYNGDVKAFASSAPGTERTVFGGTTQSDELTDQITTKFLQGWGIVGASESPSLQDFSAASFTATQFISYLHQMGVAEWNAEQEYPTAGAMSVYNGLPWFRKDSWTVGDEPNVTNSWSTVQVENRLKANQNFNVAGADGQISATPQTFTVGQEFANGRFVVNADLVNATYSAGLINADSGSYYVEYEGDFTGDFYGIKLADNSVVQTGVTISLESGNTRLTIDMSVAPSHKFAGLSEQAGVWQDINDKDSSTQAGTPEVTGTATFTNATQVINLTGIGALDNLEIGDVIQITNSLSNNKEFTIESITDANNVIVNYEHRGKTTTKSLIDEVATAGVTVNLLCKWYNAPLGLGQGWADVTSSRALNVAALNSTNRAIKAAAIISGSDTISRTLLIDGASLAIEEGSDLSGYSTISEVVTAGSSYEISAGSVTIVSWSELR